MTLKFSLIILSFRNWKGIHAIHEPDRGLCVVLLLGLCCPCCWLTTVLCPGPSFSISAAAGPRRLWRLWRLWRVSALCWRTQWLRGRDLGEEEPSSLSSPPNKWDTSLGKQCRCRVQGWQMNTMITCKVSWPRTRPRSCCWTRLRPPPGASGRTENWARQVSMVKVTHCPWASPGLVCREPQELLALAVGLVEAEGGGQGVVVAQRSLHPGARMVRACRLLHRPARTQPHIDTQKIFPMRIKITKLTAIAPRPDWLFCCDLAEVRPLTAFQCGPGWGWAALVTTAQASNFYAECTILDIFLQQLKYLLIYIVFWGLTIIVKETEGWKVYWKTKNYQIG